ncbi:MAG: hypothetical protein KF878_25130 [Planctomycetes bacterium]|nr:hypothetical protein [Planctomycetota bacterium]
MNDTLRDASGNAFDPSMGDRLVPERGTRSYDDARLWRNDLATTHNTVVGRNSKTYRGNRQQPLAAER